VKLKLPLVICILLLAAGVHAQTANVPDPASWKRYTVKNEEFSVTLPTLPAMVSSKTFSARLKKERRQRMIATSADGVTYSIFTYENSQPRQSLEDFIREQDEVGQAAGRDVTVNGFAGREYSFKQDDRPATEQYFATDEHLYRFLAHGAAADHPGVKQFFASISLGKKQQGEPIPDGPGVPLETSSGLFEKVYSGREVDQRIKLKTRPEPEYPDKAKQEKVRGVVILRAIFASDGKVKNVQVIEGLPGGLTERAIEAAKKIKFIPATKDGRFVSMWMQLEYNFNLY